MIKGRVIEVPLYSENSFFFFLLSMIDSHQNQSETDMDEGVGLHWDVQPFAAGSVK